MDKKIEKEEKEKSILERRRFLKKLAIGAIFIPPVIITFKPREAYATSTPPFMAR